MRKGKHYENKNYIKIIKNFLIMLLLVSIMYITYFFWNAKIEKEEIDELLSTVAVSSEASVLDTEEETTQRMLEVSGLQQQYSDVKAWINIEGTSINYPVMQAEDNDFYVDHDYKGEKSKRGSIFLDKAYDWSIPSSNLLIYGHNNSKDGTMFADLLKYKDENFYKQHSIIKFTTPTEDAEYEIIGVFLSRIYYKSEKNVYRWYYFVNAENEDEYDEYVQYVKEKSLYDTEKTAIYGEQLITLVTCEYSTEDGRLVVVARKK